MHVFVRPRDQTKLGNTVWPGQTAVDPSSGFSLVHDREGAANSPACKPKLEGQGQQGFEGPEKTLEIEFDPDVGHENGLRAIRREQWDAILKQVRCVGCACPSAGWFCRGWVGQCGHELAAACVFRRHRYIFLKRGSLATSFVFCAARLVHPGPIRIWSVRSEVAAGRAKSDAITCACRKRRNVWYYYLAVRA